MKYLFLATILLACKSEPKNSVVAPTDQDTTAGVPVKRDTTSIDQHDPFQTGKDTVRLNSVMDKIFKFPEVEAINKQINQTSKGKRGVSIMVHDEFEGDASYYNFMVGDNSRDDRYVTIFNFILEKKTGEIKAYDPVSDSIMTLKEWRKTRQ
jgi:hypothetical protein